MGKYEGRATMQLILPCLTMPYAMLRAGSPGPWVVALVSLTALNGFRPPPPPPPPPRGWGGVLAKHYPFEMVILLYSMEG